MPEKDANFSVYRQLSTDMRDGLKNIYRQAASAGATSTDALFTEASDELDEVVKTTESAAMSIMEIVEKQDNLAAESGKLIEGLKNGENPEALARLAEINTDLRKDLLTLITTLSFQDITGQRIKKVMGALKSIENTVLELYLSSGLILEAADKNPEKDADTLAAEARQTVEEYKESRAASQLKGPDANGMGQSAIDDMLSQLGL